MVLSAFKGFEEVSTVTSKGQTTIPKPVRQALGVNEGDQIAFRVDETGVTVRRAGEDYDPVIASFLLFLAKDIEANPGQLRSFTPELLGSIAALTEGVEFNPDDQIEGDVEL